ncbi:MAG: aspartate kinase [Crocinitomicaceae bacterium]|nr:aspartate kinase [Crocinitomicaceae bacterium]
MLVFKFGGASVKDASAVRNVAKILNLFPKEQLLVVISAMGKTTNLLETVINAFWNKEFKAFETAIHEAEKYHLQIADDLFEDRTTSIFTEIKQLFKDLLQRKEEIPSSDFSMEYDQIVSLGELLSTKIVHAFLEKENYSIAWADARKLICTDDSYRDGTVDWTRTQTAIESALIPVFEKKNIVITQGFIGSSAQNKTVTLGREGSDYSAGIFAFCTNADSVTIWKDVPGMLNADPKYFDDTVKLDEISFKEAIELSYYGASVIHPKTIKPLQNKNIPLYVKSFIAPAEKGTIIHSCMDYDELVPSFIVKHKQLLMSIMPKDFSFMVEENLREVFELLSKTKVKINLMQNSALSFSFLVDEDKIDFDRLLTLFQRNYNVKFNRDLELVTIRHYDQATIDKMSEGKEKILEQRDRQTVRLLLKK